MMQYQYLAVIFVIIMLPITLVFSAYIDAQLDTIDLQISYDTKLDNATYDAIKVFQMNTASSDTSDIVNSKIRDIEAAANSFYTSIATNFNMAGYNSDIIQNYVPALVFTLYDGFYIYSTFENTLDDVELTDDATYEDGDTITGLKPYIYYSCRYVGTGQLDVVITYSLDSYITVQGTASDGTPINDAGYLLSDVSYNDTSATYRGVTITAEDALTEYIGNETEYTYIKINGVKYYQDTDGSWFTLTNGKKTTLYTPLSDECATTNDLAYRYYKESCDFMERLDDYGITSLTSANAVDANGNSLTEVTITDEDGNTVYSFTDSSEEKIFNFSGIEEPDSAFNNHRRAVIRYVIESNLSTALANYTAENSTYEFKMPKLSEEDWDKIMNNVTLISFLQGLSIGGKIYNGYSVINNNENYEVVTENSIYIVENKNDMNSTYHRITDKSIDSNVSTSNSIGIFNMDVEKRSLGSTTSETTLYYYPHYYLGCYTCYVTQTNTGSYTNIYEYIDDCSEVVKKLYYTALGRERYSMYRIFRNEATHLAEFLNT